MRILAILTLLVISTAALTSCNTFSGMGEDLQKGGRAIQDAAQ